MNTMPKPGDKAAGFAGLIIGAICVFLVLFAIVEWTNHLYAGEKPGEAHAAATK